VKLGLSLPIHSEVRELRELLASDTGIAESHMLLTEVDDLGFHRTFSGIVHSHFGSILKDFKLMMQGVTLIYHWINCPFCFILYFWIVVTNSMNCGSVVGIATGYGLDDRGAGVQVPVGSRILTTPYCLDRL
jgi:hypothetical protein